jgi:hypothetical protein
MSVARIEMASAMLRQQLRESGAINRLAVAVFDA